MTKKQNIVSTVLNALIFLCTVWAVAAYFYGPPDLLGSHDIACFKYFTTDSNILVAVASACMLVYNIRRMSSDSIDIPKLVRMLKFAGTIAASVTLITCFLFLIPVACIRAGSLKPFPMFFAGNTFALHFSTPLLAIVSVIGFESDYIPSKKQACIGMIPTVIYSIVYGAMVLTSVWDDWYGFTFGGKYALIPVVVIVMYLFVYALSQCVRKLQTIARKEK